MMDFPFPDVREVGRGRRPCRPGISRVIAKNYVRIGTKWAARGAPATGTFVIPAKAGIQP